MAKSAPALRAHWSGARVHMRARRDSVGINVSHGNRYEYWGRVRNRGQWDQHDCVQGTDIADDCDPGSVVLPRARGAVAQVTCRSKETVLM